jgi:hypothetical protein
MFNKDDSKNGIPDKVLKKMNKIGEFKEKLDQAHEQGRLNDKKFARRVSELDKAERILNAVYGNSESRNNVISVRLNDETLQCLDDLVSANIAQSRSDAASRLIMEGIKNNVALFEQIRKHTEEIENIRQKLHQSIEDSGLGKIGSTENE